MREGGPEIQLYESRFRVLGLADSHARSEQSLLANQAESTLDLTIGH